MAHALGAVGADHNEAATLPLELKCDRALDSRASHVRVKVQVAPFGVNCLHIF